MSDLHPPELEENGLLAALQWYGVQWRARTGLALRVEGVEPSFGLNDDIRIAQEALNNIARHALANSAGITLSENLEAQQVCMIICDDGVGFDTDILNQPHTQHSGWGMRTIGAHRHGYADHEWQYCDEGGGEEWFELQIHSAVHAFNSSWDRTCVA